MARWFMLVVLCAAPASASYRKLRFTELIRQADVIVEGTISSVDDRTFTLEARSVIAGPVATSFRVAKFAEWRCASRWWAPYAADQHLLLFLRKDEAGDWEILGRGDEGEFPIADGRVFSRYSELAVSEPEPHTVYGKPHDGFAADAADMLRVLRLLRACMKPTTERSCTPEVRAAIDGDPGVAVLDLTLNFGF